MHLYIKFKQPSVSFDIDTLGVMSGNGSLMAITENQAIWQFGFLTGSPAAKAYGYGLENFCWILADQNGNILDRFDGLGKDLPIHFESVFEQEIKVQNVSLC